MYIPGEMITRRVIVNNKCSNRSIEVQLPGLLKFRPRDQLVGKSHFPKTCRSCALNSGVIVHTIGEHLHTPNPLLLN